MPFNKLNEWFNQEKELGLEVNTVLSTISPTGFPHSRVVAIREIKNGSLIFFTQRKTRKVADLLSNPAASMNFFLVMQQRQIVLEGAVELLTHEENEQYWNKLPRERQLRFSAYAPTSGQPIMSLKVLDERKRELALCFANKPIPMSDDYCGFRFTPESFLFYTVGSTTFSEVIRFTKNNDVWDEKLISP
ncbi:pyridoxine/pyridoxamine 5'-phosphate oxidase [Legionella clemsonensis]|uniref:Pyridoxine/pyridoxamine 5'-phosphate oxidase n=1 Tax=Legionella clemsonensis TaxID=1867846 RepID=A0A222P3S1_9GAMM|nr:pyridoxamine 5'-phosphate oxidase family protein [Legionella clemsonensis]ASQ46498.1 Pyridoxine/pyridoxamine 5'-phosphate oxidase [Legionella clemsonensis]